ncbi:menaquinol-cytochrome c reductase iron-sulfur subunit [Bacillaceae bacterium]
MGQNRAGEKVSRRQFLGKTGKFITVGAAVVTGMSLLSACSASSKNSEKSTGIDTSSLVLIGKKSEFETITKPVKVEYSTEIKDGWVKQKAQGFVYVTKDEKNQLLIMSPICTHLGCTVPFAPEEAKKNKPDLAFLCPCHMGEYNELGIHIGGPPPRPLDVFEPVIIEEKVYINIFSPMRRTV